MPWDRLTSVLPAFRLSKTEGADMSYQSFRAKGSCFAFFTPLERAVRGNVRACLPGMPRTDYSLLALGQAFVLADSLQVDADAA